jgi:hypothetical protein
LPQLPEPDFCTETLPPVIDKTVRGVLAELEFPQDVKPADKERIAGTNSRILNSNERLIFINISPLFGNIDISKVTPP